MALTPTETEILDQAVEAFCRTTGLTAEVEEGPQPWRGRTADARITVTAQEGTYEFAAIVKLVRGTQTLGLIAEQLARKNPDGILVTRHVTPGMAKIIQATGLAFLDTGGNAFIRRPGLVVNVIGNRPAQKYSRQRTPLVYQLKGLQVVFALLCRPDLANAPYREIARLAAVGLGTVDRVAAGLQEAGFLVAPTTRPRRLVERDKLLTRWAAAYVDALRPRLELGRFTAPTPDWWGTAELGGGDLLWGGEVAAARLTGHLRPQSATIYARELPTRFLAEHALRKDPRGTVEVLRIFWHRDLFPDARDVVPPLLIYADLAGSRDERNIETARMIYDAEIAGALDAAG